jgi:hypothetical protein
MLEKLQGLLGHQSSGEGPKTQALIKKIAAIALKQLEPKQKTSSVLLPAPAMAPTALEAPEEFQIPKNRHIPFPIQRKNLRQ